MIRADGVPVPPLIEAKPTPRPKVKPKAPCCSGGECPEGDDCSCKKTARPCGDRCGCVLTVGKDVYPEGGCPGGCHCALECPCENDCPKNYGVDLSKLGQAERVTINGREVTKDAALKELGGKENGLPEDADKPFLADVGPIADGARLDKDLASSAELAPYATTFRRQSYAEPVTDRDGKLMYPVGVYIVTAKGKAAKLMTAYTNASDLAGALRKLPPDFDPNKIPLVGPAPKPVPEPLPDPTPAPTPADEVNIWAVLATCGVGLFATGALLMRKPK